jgi:hypothetical protein
MKGTKFDGVQAMVRWGAGCLMKAGVARAGRSVEEFLQRWFRHFRHAFSEA